MTAFLTSSYIDRPAPLPLPPSVSYLGNEPEGAAFDFVAVQGYIRDKTTPANNFFGDLNSKLTYFAPSTKYVTNGLGVMVAGTTIRCHHDINTLDSSNTQLHTLFTSKTLTIVGSATYAVGQDVRLTDPANVNRWMLGRVTAWNAGTKALTISTYAASGYFVLSSWTVIVALGVWIEENRTNIALNSVFAGAVAGSPGTAPTSWLFLASTGTTAISASRSGNGSRLTLSGLIGARHFIGQTVALAASTAYVFSMTVDVVASGSINLNQFLAFSGAPGDATISFLVDGSAATGSTPVSNGKHIITGVVSAVTAGSTAIRIGVGTSGNLTVDAALTIDMPQFEAGTYVTSYIPTTTAQVTRNVDMISMATSGVPFSPTWKFYLAEFIPVSFAKHAAYCTWDNAAATEIIGISNQGDTSIVSRQNVATGGTYYINGQSNGNMTLNARQKLAGALEIGVAGRLCLNGAVPTSASLATMPQMPTPTDLRFGHRASGNRSCLNGYLKRAKILIRLVSDAEMRAMTS